MIRRTVIRFGAVAAVAASLFAGSLSGCASPAREVPPKATQQLLDLRDTLVMGKASLQKASNSARDLVERPRQDLQPQVDRFSKDLDDLNNIAVTSREQVASAEKQAESYFTNWEAQMRTMSDSMAETGSRRKAEAEASFNRLKVRLDALRSVYRPYYTSLSETQRYLKTDNTAAGLKAVEPKLKTTLRQQPAVEKAMDELIAEIDAIRAGR